MSLQEDFHASLSPSQVEERERMITATSGRTCSVLYEKSNLLGSLVKTLLESSRWFSPARRLKWDAKPLFSERIIEKEYCYDKNTLSKPSVKTLSEKDTPSNRCLFRLVPSERHIEETGYGLLPTPTVMEDRRKPNGNSNRQKKIMSNLNPYSIQELLPTVQTQGLKMCDKNGKTQFYPMELLPTPMSTDIHHAERVRSLKNAGAETMASRKKGSNRPNGLMDFMDFHGMLPTPMASDATTGAIIGKNDQFITTGNGTPRKINQNGTNGSIGLARIVQLLPTPTMRDYKGAPTIENIQKRGRNPMTNNLADCFAQTGKTSQLNPLFVEEMMGFPLMWTTLPFLSLNGDKSQSKDTEMP